MGGFYRFLMGFSVLVCVCSLTLLTAHLVLRYQEQYQKTFNEKIVDIERIEKSKDRLDLLELRFSKQNLGTDKGESIENVVFYLERLLAKGLFRECEISYDLSDIPLRMKKVDLKYVQRVLELTDPENRIQSTPDVKTAIPNMMSTAEKERKQLVSGDFVRKNSREVINVILQRVFLEMFSDMVWDSERYPTDAFENLKHFLKFIFPSDVSVRKIVIEALPKLPRLFLYQNDSGQRSFPEKKAICVKDESIAIIVSYLELLLAKGLVRESEIYSFLSDILLCIKEEDLKYVQRDRERTDREIRIQTTPDVKTAIPNMMSTAEKERKPLVSGDFVRKNFREVINVILQRVFLEMFSDILWDSEGYGAYEFENPQHFLNLIFPSNVSVRNIVIEALPKLPRLFLYQNDSGQRSFPEEIGICVKDVFIVVIISSLERLLAEGLVRESTFYSALSDILLCIKEEDLKYVQGDRERTDREIRIQTTPDVKTAIPNMMSTAEEERKPLVSGDFISKITKKAINLKLQEEFRKMFSMLWDSRGCSTNSFENLKRFLNFIFPSDFSVQKVVTETLSKLPSLLLYRNSSSQRSLPEKKTICISLCDTDFEYQLVNLFGAVTEANCLSHALNQEKGCVLEESLRNVSVERFSSKLFDDMPRFQNITGVKFGCIDYWLYKAIISPSSSNVFKFLAVNDSKDPEKIKNNILFSGSTTNEKQQQKTNLKWKTEIPLSETTVHKKQQYQNNDHKPKKGISFAEGTVTKNPQYYKNDYGNDGLQEEVTHMMVLEGFDEMMESEETANEFEADGNLHKDIQKRSVSGRATLMKEDLAVLRSKLESDPDEDILLVYALKFMREAVFDSRIVLIQLNEIDNIVTIAKYIGKEFDELSQ